MESIYFLHIPKTAGSSFKKMLASAYSQEEVLEFYQRNKLLEFKPSQHRLLLGHLGFDISALTKSFNVVTFLRCPIHRAISNYHQVLRSSEHYLHVLVKELGTFDAFIRDKHCQDCIANIQTKYLGLDINFEQLVKHHTVASLIALAPQELHSKMLALSDPDQVMKTAFQRLSKMAFFGLCERFEDSIALFKQAYPNLELKSAYAQENVTHGGVTFNQLSNEDIEILKEINYLDIQLYQSAASLFEKRWEQSYAE